MLVVCVNRRDVMAKMEQGLTYEEAIKATVKTVRIDETHFAHDSLVEGLLAVENGIMFARSINELLAES